MRSGASDLAASQGLDVERIVRVGDSVRRPATRSSPAIHGLLRHLHNSGFTGCPVPHGFDDDGREMLHYIEGEPGRFGWYPRQILVHFGSLLRDLHATAAQWRPPADASWNEPILRITEVGPQTICHNDPNPTNVIFSARRPIALVDWELAAPNSVLADLAAATWAWVPLFHEELMTYFINSPPSLSILADRISALCDGYGYRDRQALVGGALQYLHARHESMRTRSDPRLRAMWNSEQRRYSEDNIAWLERIAPDLARLLD